MAKYIMAIRYTKCDDKTQDKCLWKRKYSKCEVSLSNCHYPMKANPLCLCNDVNKCNGYYNIVQHEDKLYIFYNCTSRCNDFIQDIDSGIKNILEPMDSEYIYWGKDLDKLTKKVFKKTKPTSETDMVVDYFEKLFVAVNRRC